MMSSIINKTFNYAVTALKSQQIETIDLNSLIQALSNNNETEVVCKFLDQIKINFSDSSTHQQRKYLAAIIYCSHLSNSFDTNAKQSLSFMGALVMTFIEQATSSSDKRLGYLALSSLIDSSSSDIVYLSVNTVLKDISSKHVAVIKISLDAASHLVNVDLVPVLLPVVERRISHTDATVRIKAVTALHCMYKVAPEFLHNVKSHVKSSLSDRNPEVMAASLPYIYDVVKNDSSKFKDLPSKLVFILKQVVQGNMPVHMSRHGISAPYVQIRILRILLMAEITDETKTSLSDVLLEMMNRCQNSKHNISFAVLSECIHTVVTVFKNDVVVFNTAVQFLEKFLHSKQANLLVVGLELLAQVTNTFLPASTQYQNIVVECLSHSDPTVKKQTLNLLLTLVTKDNHKVIFGHMIKQLKSFNNSYFVKTFGERISTGAEKFSSDLTWILQTLHEIIEASGDNVSMTVCDKLLQSISKANKDELLEELKYIQRNMNDNISFHHFRIISMIVGRYWKLSNLGKADIVTLLIKQSQAQFKERSNKSAEIANILISAIKQLIYHKVLNGDEVMELIVKIAAPFMQTSPAVLQNLIELEMLMKNKEILDALNNSDIEFDGDLSFLGDTPSDAESDTEDGADSTRAAESELKHESYSKITPHVIKTSSALMASALPQRPPAQMTESFLSRKVSSEQPTSVWGKGGYKPQKSATVSLDQALRNLSAVAKTTDEDRAMLDIMNDVLMTSQSTSSDGTASDSPFHVFSETN